MKNLSRLGLLLLALWLSRRLPHPGLKFCWWAMFFLFQPFGPLFDRSTMLSFPEMDWDQVYDYRTIYLAALCLMQDRKDRLFHGVTAGLLCLLAFTALSKNTAFVLAGAAVGAVACHKLLRKDFWAALSCPLLFLFFLIVLWMLAGQQPANLPGFVRGIFAFSRGYTEAMPADATIKPALSGIQAAVRDAPVDFFGDEPGWPLLNGLNYRSRPMPIVFAAWNDALERANETFYRDPRTTPDYVICALHPTNNRFVPQDDAPALRALLDNYHPVLAEQDFLLLARNPPPLRVHAEKKSLAEFTTRFLTPIPLDARTNERVWMEAEFQPTWLGKLRAFLYRPAACYVSYRFAGDSTEYYSRFITCLGRSGCMVTPFLSDNAGVQQFYRAGDDLGGLRRIEVFGFSCDPGDQKYFRNEIRIRFYPIPGPGWRVALSQAAQP